MTSMQEAIENRQIEEMCKIAANEHLRELLNSIFPGTNYHANRYNTDDSLVLHLWDDGGNSYDIIAKKEVLICHQGNKSWEEIKEPEPPKCKPKNIRCDNCYHMSPDILNETGKIWCTKDDEFIKKDRAKHCWGFDPIETDEIKDQEPEECIYKVKCECHPQTPTIMCSKFFWKKHGMPDGGYECEEVCKLGVCPKDISFYDGTKSLEDQEPEITPEAFRKMQMVDHGMTLDGMPEVREKAKKLKKNQEPEQTAPANVERSDTS